MFLIAIMKIKKSKRANRGYDQKMQYLKINHIIKAIAHFEKINIPPRWLREKTCPLEG